MASLCAARSMPSQLSQCLHRPTTRAEIPSISRVLKFSPTISQSPSNSSRFKNALTLQVRERLFVAFASNSNPSGGDSIQDKSDGITTDATQGPPFLTILAGLLIFFIICWVFGSIIMWLFGLIVNVPPSK